MSAPLIRAVAPGDRAAVFTLVAEAFGQDEEARLVERLVADGAAVLELAAETNGAVAGHILFSRLRVEDGGVFDAVALAPLAVAPAHRGKGIAGALIEEAHRRLRAGGERLCVVLGDPAYYGRFGYAHARAAGFASDYQCDALQALAWGEAPAAGRLVYPRAFAGL